MKKKEKEKEEASSELPKCSSALWKLRSKEQKVIAQVSVVCRSHKEREGVGGGAGAHFVYVLVKLHEIEMAQP